MNKKLMALLFAVAIAPAAYAAQTTPEGTTPETPAAAAEKGFFGKTWDGVKGGATWCKEFYIGEEGNHLHRMLYTVPGTVLLGVAGYLTYKGYQEEYGKIWDIIKACVTTNGLAEYWETDKDLVISVYTGLGMMATMAGNGVWGGIKWWKNRTPAEGGDDDGGEGEGEGEAEGEAAAEAAAETPAETPAETATETS